VFISMDRYNNYTNGSSYASRTVYKHMTNAGYSEHRNKIGRAKKHTHTWMVRPPTPLESASAISMSARLERLEVEGKAVSRTWSELPPGRLSFSRVKDRRLQRAAGQMPTTKQFERQKVKHAPKTKIKVGILLDISASMGGHAALGCSLAWVLAEATRRVRGDVAVVAASNEVWPLVAPDEVQPGVIVTGTSAGGHDMGGGVLALDGALDLIEGEGARVLVVFSDGQFDTTRTKLLPLLGEAGVQVLWIEPKQLYAPEIQRPRQFYSQCEVAPEDTYTEVLEHIAAALETAVRRDKGLTGATL
jgi:hypothetical protein